MENGRLEKHVKITFGAAVAFSAMFVLGVIMLPLGATRLNVNDGYLALLVVGVAFTVLGFYGTPLLWVNFGLKLSLKRLVDSVLRENVSTLAELAAHLGQKEKKTSQDFYTAVRKYYLVGYTLKDGVIRKTSSKPIEAEKYTRKCPNCGAPVELESAQSVCPYCGSVVKLDDDAR